ncbi:uncharacterized protein LODBEIA_P49330 [Lodderomyces beijingensis]|uniref:Uncharacterized protein n=1 Tax=Lodderomyces beijingensis TaxID=1775926 RepID=A0ABP0ZRC1_9ASCO
MSSRQSVGGNSSSWLKALLVVDVIALVAFLLSYAEIHPHVLSANTFSFRLLSFPAYYLLAISIASSIVMFVGYLVSYNFPNGEWEKLGSSDVALVTGGSNGLGLEITKALMEKQATVYVLDRVAPPSKLLAGPNLYYLPCDLGNEEDISDTVDNLLRELRSANRFISVLVNNAGIRDNKAMINLDFSRVKSIFNVNTLSQVLILQKVISNHLQHNEMGQLSLVTVSSILGVFAPRNLSIYSASKAAQIMFHESLQQELKEYPKIRLLLVTPGQMDTELFKDVTPTKQLVAPVVSHVKLAGIIVERVNKGYMGCLAKPIYASFLPGVRTAPMFIQDFCRWISEMDDKIKET